MKVPQFESVGDQKRLALYTQIQKEWNLRDVGTPERSIVKEEVERRLAGSKPLPYFKAKAKRRRKLGPAWKGQSISSGTMRAVDLIPAFLRVLEVASKREAKAYSKAWKASSSQQEMGELMELLFEALEARAPTGTYFGSHPGDGAHYGFWPLELETP